MVQLKEGETTNLSQEEIETEVDKILESVDFDKNGFIEYSEFVTVAMDKKVLLSKGRLQAAFQMFDIDGSGTIAADELRRVTYITYTHAHTHTFTHTLSLLHSLTHLYTPAQSYTFLQILVDVDDAQWAQIIGEVDQNGDGEVDFDEFVDMMQKLVV